MVMGAAAIALMVGRSGEDRGSVAPLKMTLRSQTMKTKESMDTLLVY